MTDLEKKQAIKYQNPKILLVDIEKESKKLLTDTGYNVKSANLGFPYRVDPEDAFFPIYSNFNVPFDIQEHDIVVIDMFNPTIDLDFYRNSKIINKWFVNHEIGYVDPRPLTSTFVRSDFDKILVNGGVFVIFTDLWEENTYDSESSLGFNIQKFNKIGFLSILNNLPKKAVQDYSGEMFFRANKELNKLDLLKLKNTLFKYIKDCVYTCTLHLELYPDYKWIPLLKNKFGYDVAGIVSPNENRHGWILILPNFLEKTTLLKKIIEEYLPNIVPDLFVEQKLAIWKNKSEYLMEKEKNYKNEIIQIQKQADRKVEQLKKEINIIKKNNAYLFNLLTETGDSLVFAIIQALKILGFKKIKDIDKELAEQGISNQNREDLQIHDSERTLIVEVKGIVGFPSDDDALAVNKYVTLRMREWEKTNIQGLTLINHQRNKEPLERDNTLPFRQEILDVATDLNIGLMTTWDLHRLTRSFIENNWQHENVKNILYQVGRINVLPNHYQFVGTIQEFIKKQMILGIKIEACSLRKGDRIAFEFPVCFKEQICETLEFEHNSIEVGEVGMLVGTKTSLDKEDISKGVNVYKIID